MSKKNLIAILLLQTALAWSDQDPVKAAETPLVNHVSSESEQPVIALKGIVLLGPCAPELTGEELNKVEGVRWMCIRVPGSRARLQTKLESWMEGQEVSVESVKQLQALLKAYYLEETHPFVIIQVPVQDVTEGVLQFRIIESHIGEITVQGNKWHSSHLLKEFLGIHPDEAINPELLAQNLAFINRDPFLQADLIYSQGKENYTTDITLAIAERNPIQLYAGVDNTGIETVGRTRWFMGFHWGNAFGLGHQLAYQYTASLHRKQFQGVTVQYIAPLTWHHFLNVYGGFSVVNPHFFFPASRNHGWSCQASLRYEIPLSLSSHFSHKILFGGDFKRTNNTFEFSDVSPSAGQNVNLTQVAIEYNGSYRKKSYQIDFDGSLFCSPGSWLPDQSSADYRTLRRGGQPKWIYFRGTLSYLQRLPASWAFYLLSRGQISSQNLLPSEQYGIGGYDTVRGYEERTLNKDTALLTTVEVRTPQFSIAHHFSKSSNDGLQFLAFLDWGWGTDHIAEVPGFKAQYLLGAGPGLRYVYDTYLTARFDVGVKLHQDHYRGGAAMIHFSLIGSF